MLVSATMRKVADMASDNHDDKAQEEPQAQEDLGQQQAAQDLTVLNRHQAVRVRA